MSQEKRWHSPCKLIADTVKYHKHAIDSSDVTLVCDDKTFLKAHKVVLSASSPVLRNILLSNPHHHPVVFLRDVHHDHLVPVLQFMYQGQAIIHKEDLEAVLEVASALQVKCLYTDLRQRLDNCKIQSSFSHEESQNMEMHHDDEEFTGELDVLNSKDKIEQGLIFTDTETVKSGMLVCEVCRKDFSRKSALVKHQKRKHSIAPSFSCNRCEYRSKDRNIIKNHKESAHAVKYSCNQCNHQAGKPSKLEQHIKTKHLGVRYPCDHCDYKATKLAF